MTFAGVRSGSGAVGAEVSVSTETVLPLGPGVTNHILPSLNILYGVAILSPHKKSADHPAWDRRRFEFFDNAKLNLIRRVKDSERSPSKEKSAANKLWLGALFFKLRLTRLAA